MESNLNYQFFEHTADIGVIVEGKTIEELISNLVLVFSDLTTDIEKLDNSIEMVISVNGKDLEDAIIRLIEEVIFIFETKKFLPKECSILLEDKRITSRMKGELTGISE
jgi:SHS2 domain-containing protein